MMNEQRGTSITDRVRDKLNWLPFALVLAAGWGASWDYESTSSSRRGRGLEALHVGFERMLTGDYAPEQAGGVLIGRILLAVAVLAAVALVVRRLRRSTARTATRQQHLQPGQPMRLS